MEKYCTLLFAQTFSPRGTKACSNIKGQYYQGYCHGVRSCRFYFGVLCLLCPGLNSTSWCVPYRFLLCPITCTFLLYLKRVCRVLWFVLVHALPRGLFHSAWIKTFLFRSSAIASYFCLHLTTTNVWKKTTRTLLIEAISAYFTFPHELI